MEIVDAEFEEAVQNPVADVEYEEVSAPLAKIPSVQRLVMPNPEPDTDEYRSGAASPEGGYRDFAHYGAEHGAVREQGPRLWRRPATWVMTAGLVAAGASLSGVFQQSDEDGVSAASLKGSTVELVAKRIPVQVRAKPASAIIELNGIQVGVGEYQGSVEGTGEAHVLRVFSPGYETQVIEFSDNAPREKVVLLPEEVAIKPAARHAGRSHLVHTGPASGSPRSQLSDPVAPLPEPRRISGADVHQADARQGEIVRPNSGRRPLDTTLDPVLETDSPYLVDSPDMHGVEGRRKPVQASAAARAVSEDPIDVTLDDPLRSAQLGFSENDLGTIGARDVRPGARDAERGQDRPKVQLIESDARPVVQLLE